MNRRATRFFRSFVGRLAEEQVADDDGDGRIDQPPAGEVEIRRALAS